MAKRLYDDEETWTEQQIAKALAALPPHKLLKKLRQLSENAMLEGARRLVMEMGNNASSIDDIHPALKRAILSRELPPLYMTYPKHWDEEFKIPDYGDADDEGN